MQKYEEPMMEIMITHDADIVTLSVEIGDGPVIDAGDWSN